jgi:hypothetical protein
VAKGLLGGRGELGLWERGVRKWFARAEDRDTYDSLGTLRDGVLGQLSGKDQSTSSLDLSRRDGGSVVVDGQLGSLGGDSLENVGDERVQDGHGLVGDTSVGVDLLEDLVDVGRVGFDPSLGSLLLLAGFLGGSGLLGRSLGGSGSLGGRGLGGGGSWRGKVGVSKVVDVDGSGGDIPGAADLGAIVIVVVWLLGECWSAKTKVKKMMKFGKRRQKYGRGPSWLYTHRARPGLSVYTRLASAAIITEPDDFPTFALA